jgi:hypothetical protein
MYLLSTYQTQVQELVHDTAGIDYTTTELTNFVNNARNRVALDFHNVRYLYQNASLIGGQEQYPLTGGVYGLTINSGGLNYVSPVIGIAAPGSGITATATAVVSGGVITQINMTSWGTGYSAAPAVTVTDVGGGTGATLVAMTGYSVFDLNSISVLWGTQRYTLGWLPFTAFQAFCRSNPTLQRQPAVWTTIWETNTVFVYPIPDQAYLCDIDAIGLPSPLVNPTDADTQVLDPVGDCVQYWAAHLALLKLQNFEQAGYYEKKYEKRAMQMQATRQDRRIPNIYRNYYRRINRW